MQLSKREGANSMLIGTYRHQIDEKKRMRVPAKLKTELGANFIITKGSNHCLFAFTEQEFNESIIEKSKGLAMFDVSVQKPIRLLISSAFQTEEDNQGRILIPQELRDYAQIKKQIVFIGVGNRVEIWSEELWHEYNDLDFESSAQELAKLGV